MLEIDVEIDDDKDNLILNFRDIDEDRNLTDLSDITLHYHHLQMCKNISLQHSFEQQEYIFIDIVKSVINNIILDLVTKENYYLYVPEITLKLNISNDIDMYIFDRIEEFLIYETVWDYYTDVPKDSF